MLTIKGQSPTLFSNKRFITRLYVNNSKEKVKTKENYYNFLYLMKIKKVNDYNPFILSIMSTPIPISTLYQHS